MRSDGYDVGPELEDIVELEQRKQEQASLAEGADPSRFLKQFAGARTDLFGAQADEEAQARREAQAQQLAREKVRHVWDGHTNSATTAQDARQRQARLDEQITQMQPSAPAAPVAGPQAPTVPAKRPSEDTSEKKAAPRLDLITCSPGPAVAVTSANAPLPRFLSTWFCCA